MGDFLDFFSFKDPNIRYVVFGSVLLAASSAMVGCFTLLKKKALVGDAVAHSVLPGVCMAFLFSSSKNNYFLIIGAFITGWLSLLAIDYLTANTKLKKDAAIALVLSVFFGIGIVFLTYIQQSGEGAQSGLDSFIFGKAATLVGPDLLVFSVLGLVLIITIALFFKEFTLIAFDEPFAQSVGMPTRKLDLLLTTLTVLAVVTGITAVGVVLMAAMLITPAAAARYWTDNLRIMVVLAALFGAIAGISGAYISYTAPSMPTGPWMVVVSSAIAFFSFFFAPEKGIVAKRLRLGRIRRNFLEENLLKLFYHLGESTGKLFEPRTVEDLQARRDLARKSSLKRSLFRMQFKGFLRRHSAGWVLTEPGMLRAARVVKLHRLWELYLTQHLGLAADHVHDDAETIEHIITPELEQELESILQYPETDPHDQSIPRIEKP